MKKRAWVPLIIATLLLVAVPPMSEAWVRGGHGGGRVVIVGPAFWWGPYPYYYPYPYAVYAPPPAPVIVEQAPDYVTQQPAAPQSYWYYCPSAKAYYPNVPTCAEAWIKVPPRAE